MNEQRRPDLAHLASTMAVNVARVNQYVELLSSRIDQLVAAAGRKDWSEVKQLSGQLAESGRASGHRAVSALAQRVCEEAGKPDNATAVKKSLIRLIGTCGRTGLSCPKTHEQTPVAT